MRDDSSDPSGQPDDERYPTVVEYDAYDRAAWQRVLEESPALVERLEAGQRLFPGFRALGQDIFCALFKYTLTVAPEVESEQGRTALARTVLGWVRSARGLERLRAETVLDEARAAFGTLRVLDRVYRMLAHPERFSQRRLLAEFELGQLEERVEELEEQLEASEQLAESPLSERDPEAFGRMVEGLEQELGELRRRLRKMRDTQAQGLGRLPADTQTQLRDLIDHLPERIEDNDREMSAFGQHLGLPEGATRGSATAKLDLGDSLAQNAKLKLLARMVGAFREFAQAQRRSTFERRPAEVHAIDMGRELARLLPAELSLRRHPLLRREFMRRFAEAKLLHYAVEGLERAGRGPMVVCLDGSGSMQGEKELWAKAMALTLLEIARRQKRHFRAIVFSGGRHDLRVFDLLERPSPGQAEPPKVELRELMDFAEHFPGGGTDFEAPLNKALELLETQAQLKGGDIVFVTDGAASISPAWLKQFNAARTRLEFSVYAVLVDTGRRIGQELRTDTVARFADRVTSVSQLTAEAVKEIFIRV
ncbi:MAG: VWA domain-containing protein [Myxococcota bacterium]